MKITPLCKPAARPSRGSCCQHPPHGKRNQKTRQGFFVCLFCFLVKLIVCLLPQIQIWHLKSLFSLHLPLPANSHHQGQKHLANTSSGNTCLVFDLRHHFMCTQPQFNLLSGCVCAPASGVGSSKRRNHLIHS